MNTGTTFSLISLALAIASFFIGRHTAAKNDGKEAGTIVTKLDDLSRDVGRVENRVDQMNSKLDNQIALLREDVTGMREQISKLEGRMAALDGKDS